jgi:glycosyltransferase involved in cell wall biosynthesis
METTVIIPTYNRRDFLKEAIASIQQQTYRDFELIVVDDGSTDDTADYVRTLGDSIRSLHQPNSGPAAARNLGIRHARNLGIRHARGEFISFLDSDDLWYKEKLQTQIDFMKSNPEAVVCYTDETWIRRGVRVNQGKRHQKYSGWIFEKCLPLCIVSPSSVLMRRRFFEAVGEFDEQLPVCEDYDLWLRASLRFPFHFISEELIVKRGGHAGQLSTSWGMDRYRVQSLLKLLNADHALTLDQREAAVNQLRQMCRILEMGFLRRGKIEEANGYRDLLERFEA